MAAQLMYPPELNMKDYFGIWDDFLYDQTDLIYTDTVTDSGSALVGATRRGVLNMLPSDGTEGDNDECYINLTNSIFNFIAAKPIQAGCRLNFAEAATNAANVAFGILSGGGAANLLLDNGGGPVASATFAMIYKIDGGTVWRCRSQVGAAVGQTDSVSTTTAGGTSDQLLEIFVEPTSISTIVEITYKVDGHDLRDSNNLVINHRLVIANAVAMGLFAGVKNGTAAQQALDLDYWYGFQKR